MNSYNIPVLFDHNNFDYKNFDDGQKSAINIALAYAYDTGGTLYTSIDILTVFSLAYERKISLTIQQALDILSSDSVEQGMIDGGCKKIIDILNTDPMPISNP